MIRADNKIAFQHYFAHACALREKVEFERKHNEDRIRVMHDKDRIMENRKLGAKEHEEIRAKNEIALDRAEEQKMAFLKKNLDLNII